MRHFFVVGAVGHFEERVFALATVIKAFHGGSGGAENDYRAFHLTADDGEVARVIARRFLLLVGVLMFFVHNDEAEGIDRGKNCGARTDDNASAALANLVPFVVALAGGEMAVQDGDERLQRPRAKASFEALDSLGRERDFGDEDDGALALFESVGNGLKVNFGFAAAGDSVEEEGASSW